MAVVATLSPLTFLVVAFDLSRLMGWTYFGFFVVAVFWLSGARAAPRPSAIWPWTTVPLVLAVFFWTTPTIYAWVDLSRLLKCERFCFKEQTPQGRALDLFRRRAIAPPIWEFTAPGFLTPGQTGYNEKSDDGNNQIRIARAGRDEPGSVMDLNFAIDDKVEGVTVRAPEQTQRAIIGAGAHRIAISYRSAGVETSNAETRFYVYDSRWTHSYEFFRMPLSASETEFTVTFTPPPDLAGNSFRWTIHYTGVGVFELREVTFLKVGEET